MRSAPLLFAGSLAACLQIGTGTGSGNGSGATAGSAPLAHSGASDAGPSGSNCVELPAAQGVICEQVDSCPGVFVDPGAFPDCGFRLRAGGGLDLECLCGTALCPIGVPTTCDQAKHLLDVQNVLGVCVQRDEGRCVELLLADAGNPGVCDRSCADSCAGAPSCIQLCGC